MLTFAPLRSSFVFHYRFVIGMSGKVLLHEGGAPGSWQDVTHLRKMRLGRAPWEFFRQESLDGVTDMLLADGAFISVSPAFDPHCLCPPQNFAPGSPEAAQYAVHRHFRVVSENVPGAIKNLFEVIDSPPKVGTYRHTNSLNLKVDEIINIFVDGVLHFSRRATQEFVLNTHTHHAHTLYISPNLIRCLKTTWRNRGFKKLLFTCTTF